MEQNEPPWVSCDCPEIPDWKESPYRTQKENRFMSMTKKSSNTNKKMPQLRITKSGAVLTLGTVSFTCAPKTGHPEADKRWATWVAGHVSAMIPSLRITIADNLPDPTTGAERPKRGNR